MLGYYNVLSGIFLERDSQIIKKKKIGCWYGGRDLNLEPPEKVASMPTAQPRRCMCLHRFTTLFLRHFMALFQLCMLHGVV